MADTGLFEGMLPTAVTAGAGAALASGMISSGETSADNLRKLGTDATAATAMTPYSVKSAVGDLSIGADGGTSGFIGSSGGTGLQDYGAGQATLGQAASMAGDASSNPAYDQAMGGYASSDQMAMANASNAMTGQAMDAYGGGLAGMAGAQQGALGASQQMMANSIQDTAGREQDIYSRMMAMQQPGMDRATAAMETRAHAQGRGGISGSQYGGSGEQFANSRAQAEARNSAAFGAMGQAQTEMMNQGQLAGQYGQLGQGYAGVQGQLGQMVGNTGFQNAQLGQQAAGMFSQNAQGIGQLGSDQARLGQSGALAMGQIGGQQAGLGLDRYNASYNDANLQLAQGQLGMGNADMAQTGQIAGANLGAQLGLGAEQVSVNSQKAASELFGNMIGASAGALGQLGSSVDGTDWGQTINDMFGF